MQTTDDALRWWSWNSPDAVALVMRGDEVTYLQLHQWVDRVARTMSNAGVKPGDRVGVIGENCLEWAIVGLATLRCGAVVTGFGQRSAAPELAELCRQTTPGLIFAGSTHHDVTRRAAKDAGGIEVCSFDEITALRTGPERPFDPPAVDPHDPAVIVFSSGTTGLPKGVVYTAAGMLSCIFEWSLMDPVYRRGARMLGVLPLAPFGGFVNGVLACTVLGATLYLEPGFEPAAALRALTEHRINLFFGVITVYRMMSALPEFEHADLSALDSAVGGGGPVPPLELAKWHQRGAALRQAYGLTESGGTMSWSSREEARDHPDRCGRGGVFRHFQVVRPDGTRCAPGEVGEIVINGPSVMPGYWNDPEASAQALRGGWLHSGDLGELDSEGRLKVVDRLKDVIISGGYNIASGEVERCLGDLDGIDEVAVIGIEDEKFGQVPGAVLRTRTPLSPAEIAAYCRSQLADYKVPRRILIVEDPLPRNANTKIVKQEVRDRYAAALAATERV